jgi:hypothetical protein
MRNGANMVCLCHAHHHDTDDMAATLPRYLIPLLFLHHLAASAGDRFEEAVRAAEAGDYAEAFCIWKPMAQDGHREAQYNLGWMYANGYGLAVNEPQAIYWWRMAAEQGHHDAEFALGMSYLNGEGVKRDVGTAMDWFIRAARGGVDDGIHILLALVARDDPDARQAAFELMRNEPSLLGTVRHVKATLANIRNAPGTKETRVLKTVRKGTLLVELEQAGKWSWVGVPGYELIGWIHQSLVERGTAQ